MTKHLLKPNLYIICHLDRRGMGKDILFLLVIVIAVSAMLLCPICVVME